MPMWEMGADGVSQLERTARLSHRIWTAHYHLSGQASGAPRSVRFAADGQSIRAEDALGNLWVSGPSGEIVVHAGDSAQWYGTDNATVFHPPFPEAPSCPSTRSPSGDRCPWS